MKKVFTITSLFLLTLCSVYAQSNQAIKSTSVNERIKNAKSTLSKSADTYVKNSNFSQWENDSIITASNNTIHYQRPSAWAPVSGFLISFFMDTPIPLSMYIDSNNDTAALIHIDTNQMGTDMATVISTNQKPYSFSANYKFNGSPSAASIEVYATKYDPTIDSSILVGIGVASISENTTGEFQSISSDIYYLDESIVPDSILIFATYLDGAVGSLFIVDDIQLSYTLTGIEYDKHKKINVYPNPAKNFIALNSENNSNEQMKLEIYSPEGKLLKKIESYMPNQSIDISDLISGMYMLRIHTKAEVISKKIVVE